MQSPLNSPLLNDSGRATSALRNSAAGTSSRSASSEESALQFKQMLSKLEVSTVAPKASAIPLAATSSANNPSSARMSGSEHSNDRVAERLAERRNEALSNEQKSAARRAQAPTTSKPTPTKSAGGEWSSRGANKDRTTDAASAETKSTEARKRNAEENDAQVATSATERSNHTPGAEAGLPDSGLNARQGGSQGAESGQEENDPSGAERADESRLGDSGVAQDPIPMNSVNTDIARPARRDLSTDGNSRRSTSLDRSQNQGLGRLPEVLAGLANSQAQGAQADRDRGSLAGGSEFAKLLQTTAAASNTELGSSLGSNPAAAQAAASLEALSRSQASDPLAGSFSNISSSEAAQVHLSSPLHQPAFAPELGARLSLLAADGVQEAQLHLNPADMGPVQVQIVIEGQQAQISFHAEQADTRRVLEQSLPDLAAALRDNGLTLSGGGVFQQAQDSSRQTPEAQEQRSARRGPRGLSPDSSSGPEPIQARPLRRSQGVVDLYA